MPFALIARLDIRDAGTDIRFPIYGNQTIETQSHPAKWPAWFAGKGRVTEHFMALSQEDSGYRFTWISDHLLTVYLYFGDIAYWRIRTVFFILYGVGIAFSLRKMIKRETAQEPVSSGRTIAAVATIAVALIVTKIIFSYYLPVFLMSQLTLFPLGVH